MNATEALKMVEGIPAENFIKWNSTNGIDKCCFLGHHSRLTSDNPDDYSIANCHFGGRSRIYEASQLYCKKNFFRGLSIVDINDTQNIYQYTEPEIKDRLTHFLTDMIKAGY